MLGFSLRAARRWTAGVAVVLGWVGLELSGGSLVSFAQESSTAKLLELPPPGIFDSLLALEGRGAAGAEPVDVALPGRQLSAEEAAVVLGFRLADGLAAIKSGNSQRLQSAWEDCQTLAQAAGGQGLGKDGHFFGGESSSPRKVFAEWSHQQDLILQAVPARELVLAGMWVQGTRHVLAHIGSQPELSVVLREPLYLGELERAVRQAVADDSASALSAACAGALESALPLVSLPPGIPLSAENLDVLRRILEECVLATP